MYQTQDVFQAGTATLISEHGLEGQSGEMKHDFKVGLKHLQSRPVSQNRTSCAHDAIVPGAASRVPVLDQRWQLASNLWIDQHNATSILDQKRKLGIVDDSEAFNLLHFIDHGYMVLDLGLPENVTMEFDRFVKEIWKTRPSNCLAKHDSVSGGIPTPASDFPFDWVDPETGLPRLAGTKILEAHSHSEVIHSFLNQPKLFRMVELILEDVAVATQSLLFSHGSVQDLHRDPWFVPTNPASSMLASWLALQDIDADSGPLSFYPGSHRIPWTLLDTNDVIFNGASAESQHQHQKALFDHIDARDLQKRHFLAKRGEAIIWHAGLVHGGSEVLKQGLLRRSFVVHYDKLRNHPKKFTGYHKPGVPGVVVKRADKAEVRDCMHAFPDPMMLNEL